MSNEKRFVPLYAKVGGGGMHIIKALKSWESKRA